MLPRERDTQLAVAYLVAATVGLFLCILYVVQRWTASATAYTFVSMPVVAVLTGAVLLDEPMRRPWSPAARSWSRRLRRRALAGVAEKAIWRPRGRRRSVRRVLCADAAHHQHFEEVM